MIADILVVDQLKLLHYFMTGQQPERHLFPFIGGPKVQFLFSAPLFLFSSPLVLFSAPCFSSLHHFFSSPYHFFSSPHYFFSSLHHFFSSLHHFFSSLHHFFSSLHHVSLLRTTVSLPSGVRRREVRGAEKRTKGCGEEK